MFSSRLSFTLLAQSRDWLRRRKGNHPSTVTQSPKTKVWDTALAWGSVDGPLPSMSSYYRATKIKPEPNPEAAGAF